MTLPVELLALIVEYASSNTLTRLACVSRCMYTLATRALYASIPYLSTQHTAVCLHTLAHTPSLARLVRSYALKLTHRSFPNLARALANMSNLTDLSLQLGIFATSTLLASVSSDLSKFVCVLQSDPAYPISRFLESQPGIQELYLVCRDGLSDLAPDALPALRDVAAPMRILAPLVSTRLGHLRRISALGTIVDAKDIITLGDTFRQAPTQPPPGSLVDLVLGLDVASPQAEFTVVARALALLGLGAPWIGLLRLEIHQGHVDQNALNTFTHALTHFTHLKTLVLMSQPPPRRAYIRPQPVVSARRRSEPVEVPIPAPWPDALHDPKAHDSCLQAWHEAQPSLERVVFPIGVYTYVDKR